MKLEKDKERFAQNAPGPFYVADGECIGCRAPEVAAPDLMEFDEEARHCYFKKQPSTPEEWEQAVSALWVSCCEAHQYGGDDPAIQRLITEPDVSALKQMRRKKPWWKFW
jgi:hypothetical protein